MVSPSPIWTFLPGLHGTDKLFSAITKVIPSNVATELIELPASGKQDYSTLTQWLDQQLPGSPKRLLIAESFSGPLAIRLAALRPEQISGIVLCASFCDAPLNPGIAMLPLRPLFMVKPPNSALRHFLLGSDASDIELTELRKVIQAISSGTLVKRVRTILNLEESDNPPIDKIPMLILQAQSDNLVPWEAQSRLISSYPKASVHWIESPHLILQREPQQCVTRIQQFIENHSRKSTGSI